MRRATLVVGAAILAAGMMACEALLDTGSLRQGDAGARDASTDVRVGTGSGTGSASGSGTGTGTGSGTGSTRDAASDARPLRDSGPDGAADANGADAGCVSGIMSTNGHCVVVLANSQQMPAGIALGGGDVFWVNEGNSPNQGSVVKVPSSGMGAAVTLASQQAGPYGIAVDSSNVYWTNKTGNTVMSVPIGGGPPTTLASSQGTPQFIAVASGTVYWTNLSSGEVMKAVVGSGTSSAFTTAQSLPAGIAVSGDTLCWLTNAQVETSPLSAANPTALGAATSNSGWIAVDASYAYWTDMSTGSVMKIAVAGSGGLRTLATMQGAPTAGIAVDATNAYTSAGDAVMVTPLTGVGGATPFVQGTHSLAIAVDSNNVYFTDPSNGTIVAVPK